MNKDTLKKAIASIGVAGAIAGGSVVIDNANVTDAEIKASIELATTNGTIPLIDLSKVSMERITKGYLSVAQDNGVALDSDASSTKDVYELIRQEKKKHGKVVKPRTNQTEEVK